MADRSGSITIVGANELATYLRQLATDIRPKTYNATQHWAAVTKRQIQSFASGRPGPEIVTGEYVGSWKVVIGTIEQGSSAAVTTDQPQMDRLEHGYYDTDSMGREYHQGPFPHIAPAVAAVSEGFFASMAELVA